MQNHLNFIIIAVLVTAYWLCCINKRQLVAQIFFFIHFHSQQKTYCKDHFVNVCTIEEYNIESMWDKNRNFFFIF